MAEASPSPLGALAAGRGDLSDHQALLARYLRLALQLGRPAGPVHPPAVVPAKKCPYCDFNSHEGGRRRGRPPRRAIWTRCARRPGAGAADGLGPPALLVHLHRRRHAQPVLARAIERLLADVRALPLTPGCEIAGGQPGTFERERFAPSAAGVNRLSIGVQSFDDAPPRHYRARATRARRVPRWKRPRAAFDTFNST